MGTLVCDKLIIIIRVERKVQNEKNGAEVLKEITVEGKKLDFWLPILAHGFDLMKLYGVVKRAEVRRFGLKSPWLSH